MDMLLLGEAEPLTNETKQCMVELRQEILLGLEELKLGESISGEQVFEELRRLSEAKSG